MFTFNAHDEGLKNPVARLSKTGKYVFAGVAHRCADEEEFQCLECDEALIFKREGTDGKRQHFAHKTNTTSCHGMSSEHLTAQLLLLQHIERFSFQPCCRRCREKLPGASLCSFQAKYVRCDKEFKLDKFFIDVAVFATKTKRIIGAVEVHWTNPVSAEKLGFLREKYPYILYEVEAEDVLQGLSTLDSENAPRIVLASRGTAYCGNCLQDCEPATPAELDEEAENDELVAHNARWQQESDDDEQQIQDCLQRLEESGKAYQQALEEERCAEREKKQHIKEKAATKRKRESELFTSNKRPIAVSLSNLRFAQPAVPGTVWQNNAVQHFQATPNTQVIKKTSQLPPESCAVAASLAG
jgi:hypothetical protein